ncbi:tetratricopeptide repeat protein 28-like [Oculina patagonica]
MRVDGKTESRSPPSVQKNCLSALNDVIVAPVIHQLRGNELVIVPDGPLFLVPFAALQDAESRYLCESFRIHVVPSLTCLKMIMDAPPDHHCKRGALIVGDPWVQEVVDILGIPKLSQLPGARKEAEMIGEIVKSSPLIGTDATKEEVLKRLNSVALIHLAAHGRIKTGEIALAPNTSRKSPNPREEDFLLTMSDVLSVGLRARLVVLSCCHSGRGEIKDEGVVGIARAFLGAGARSVLVSLWALEDEATMEFMRVF